MHNNVEKNILGQIWYQIPGIHTFWTSKQTRLHPPMLIYCPHHLSTIKSHGQQSLVWMRLLGEEGDDLQYLCSISYKEGAQDASVDMVTVSRGVLKSLYAASSQPAQLHCFILFRQSSNTSNFYLTTNICSKIFSSKTICRSFVIYPGCVKCLIYNSWSRREPHFEGRSVTESGDLKIRTNISDRYKIHLLECWDDSGETEERKKCLSFATDIFASMITKFPNKVAQFFFYRH